MREKPAEHGASRGCLSDARHHPTTAGATNSHQDEQQTKDFHPSFECTSPGALLLAPPGHCTRTAASGLVTATTHSLQISNCEEIYSLPGLSRTIWNFNASMHIGWQMSCPVPPQISALAASSAAPEELYSLPLADPQPPQRPLLHDVNASRPLHLEPSMPSRVALPIDPCGDNTFSSRLSTLGSPPLSSPTSRRWF